jgi:alkylhydroperoxidase family enzyme
MTETKSSGGLAPPSDRLTRVAPEPAAGFERLEMLALEVSDPVLLELVRLRMAHLLGDERGMARRSEVAMELGLTEQKISELARWPTSDEFSPTERACLGLAEQYVIDVSAVSDADTQPVLELLGAAGLYGFVQALWVIDESIRLDLALGAAFADDAPARAEARS